MPRMLLITLVLALAVPSARAQLDLGLSSASYLGQGPQSRQKNYSSFTTTVDTLGVGPTFVTRAFIQGLISFNDEDFRFIEAPELYVGTNPQLFSWKKGSHAQFTIGRKLESWSHLDEHWGLGTWQPRFRWDYLRPQQAGLTGVQSQVKEGPFAATLFYSPLFIPDRGAPIDFADGRISSVSPWALNPPYIATYRGKDTEIRYSAEIPDVLDVVQHHTLSGMLSYGGVDGPWASVAAAYKPLNQLPMAFDPAFQLPLSGRTAPPFIDVRIYPRVTYHTVYSLDGGWKSRYWDFWGSYLADIPRDDYTVVPERVTQSVPKMSLISPTVNYHFLGRGPHSGMVSVSYLKRFGEDQPDTGIDSTGSSANDSTSAFDSRYPYAEALLFGLRTPTWMRLTADAKLLYDISRPGTIFSWNVSYQPEREWTMYLAADVLTSLSDDTPEIGTDFIFRYRANDRVMGGVSYAF